MSADDTAAWRNLASDAIDTLRAFMGGASRNWVEGKLTTLSARGEAIVDASRAAAPLAPAPVDPARPERGLLSDRCACGHTRVMHVSDKDDCVACRCHSFDQSAARALLAPAPPHVEGSAAPVGHPSHAFAIGSWDEHSLCRNPGCGACSPGCTKCRRFDSGQRLGALPCSGAKSGGA